MSETHTKIAEINPGELKNSKIVLGKDPQTPKSLYFPTFPLLNAHHALLTPPNTPKFSFECAPLRRMNDLVYGHNVLGKQQNHVMLI